MSSWFLCRFCQHHRPGCPHQRHFNTQILLVFENEVLEHGVVEGGELGQGLDELQAVLPLTIQDQLLRGGRWKEIRRNYSLFSHLVGGNLRIIDHWCNLLRLYFGLFQPSMVTMLSDMINQWYLRTCRRKTMSSERSPLMTPLSRSRLTLK